jgi:hypothetical protein
MAQSFPLNPDNYPMEFLSPYQPLFRYVCDFSQYSEYYIAENVPGDMRCVSWTLDFCSIEKSLRTYGIDEDEDAPSPIFMGMLVPRNTALVSRNMALVSRRATLVSRNTG